MYYAACILAVIVSFACIASPEALYALMTPQHMMQGLSGQSASTFCTFVLHDVVFCSELLRSQTFSDEKHILHYAT